MASSSQTTNRRQVALLALTLGVVMLGFGIVIPVYPFYIQSMGASGKELGLLIALSPALQLFFSPIWGLVWVRPEQPQSEADMKRAHGLRGLHGSDSKRSV